MRHDSLFSHFQSLTNSSDVVREMCGTQTIALSHDLYLQPRTEMLHFHTLKHEHESLLEA